MAGPENLRSGSLSSRRPPVRRPCPGCQSVSRPGTPAAAERTHSAMVVPYAEAYGDLQTRRGCGARALALGVSLWAALVSGVQFITQPRKPAAAIWTHSHVYGSKAHVHCHRQVERPFGARALAVGAARAAPAVPRHMSAAGTFRDNVRP
jgi:hypothetical protein